MAPTKISHAIALATFGLVAAVAATPIAAQQIIGGGGGYSTSPSASSAVSWFYSPIWTNSPTPGVATATYTLPAAALANNGTGRLHITAIGNGGPGGSGGTGSGVIRTGGGGGGPGLKNTFDVRMKDFLTLYPSATGIFINFGTLAAPGAAQTASTSAGNPGASTDATLYLNANNSSGAVIAAVPAGGPGGAGQPNGTAAAGGRWASQTIGLVVPKGVTDGQASSATGITPPTPTTNPVGPNIDDLIGASGAGAGGGLNAANLESAGGAAGKANENPFSVPSNGGPATVGTPGAGNGLAAATPFNGSSPIAGVGGSGGGSSNSATVAAGNGGAGAGYGAPGGGGGAGTNGSGSGAGGPGSYGCVEIDWLPY